MLYCITIYCQFASYCANKAALQKHNGVNLAWLKQQKNFSYRRGTARRVLSVEIMSTAGQLYRCTKNAGDEGIVRIGDPGQSRWKVSAIFNLFLFYTEQ